MEQVNVRKMQDEKFDWYCNQRGGNNHSKNDVSVSVVGNGMNSAGKPQYRVSFVFRNECLKNFKADK